MYRVNIPERWYTILKDILKAYRKITPKINTFNVSVTLRFLGKCSKLKHKTDRRNK
jgi:hypothetical protein